MPDLAAEVRSPSTWRHDVGAKKAGYERAGPARDARQVLVSRRSQPNAPTFDVALELGADETLESSQLPGFALPLERLFAER